MSYLNKHYRRSARTHNRFFRFYDFDPSSDFEKDFGNYLKAFHEIGADLIGDPFDVNFAVSRMSPDEACSAFWNEERIANSVAAKAYLLEVLPSDVRQAFSNIVEFTQARSNIRNGAVVITDGSSEHNALYSQVFADFQAIWDAVPILDPRLSKAEELFMSARGDEAGLDFSFGRGQEGVIHNLDWMSQPDNAKRIASMFLYSRFSQHFRSVDGDVLEFSERVAEKIDAGQGRLVKCNMIFRPLSFFNDVGGKGSSVAISPLEYLRTVSEDFRQNLKIDNFKGYCGRDTKDLHLINAVGLAKSISRMIDDYTLLRDGRWARQVKLSLEGRMDLNDPQFA